jgi:hypothetical protein
MAKVTIVEKALVPTIMGAMGMLAAFSFTFAAQKTFDILVTTDSKWKRLALVWGYAALIFFAVIIVLWQCSDIDEETITIEAKNKNRRRRAK